MSICTGAVVVPQPDYAPTDPSPHVEDIADLGRPVTSASLNDTSRWVPTIDVITAGGVTNGIAAALHLVERATDRDLAQATAHQMDDSWTPRADVHRR